MEQGAGSAGKWIHDGWTHVMQGLCGVDHVDGWTTLCRTVWTILCSKHDGWTRVCSDTEETPDGPTVVQVGPSCAVEPTVASWCAACLHNHLHNLHNNINLHSKDWAQLCRLGLVMH